MQVEVDVKCMETNFGGRGSSGFGDMATFQKWPNSPFEAWAIYSPWSSKNLNDWNQFKKFMQLGVDVTCMRTIFGGRGPPVLEIWLPFKNGQISFSGHGL